MELFEKYYQMIDIERVFLGLYHHLMEAFIDIVSNDVVSQEPD